MISTGIRSFFVALLATALVPHARDASADDDDGPRGLQIRTLSTHADRVSGDDVLKQAVAGDEVGRDWSGGNRHWPVQQVAW